MTMTMVMIKLKGWCGGHKGDASAGAANPFWVKPRLSMLFMNVLAMPMNTFSQHTKYKMIDDTQLKHKNHETRITLN